MAQSKLGIAIITGGTSGIALGASKVQFYTAKVVEQQMW